MSEIFNAGDTNQSIDLYIQDTNGNAINSLTYSDLIGYYRKSPSGTPTSITFATQTVGGAWTSAGFVFVGNMSGVYRYDIPNAHIESPGMVHTFITASGCAPTLIRYDCRPTIADGVLKRDFSAASGEASRSMLNALRMLRNNWYISNNVLYITKEDDTTIAWSGAVVGGNGSGISSMDPY